MFLAKVLTSLKNIEENDDRQEVLAKSLKNPEKLAKTILRIEFLTACRRHKITPRFIEDSLKPVNKIFPNNRKVQLKCQKLSKSLLNDAIAETYRTKAYLMRERDRLSAAIAGFLTEDKLVRISALRERVFEMTIHENRPRLLRKFHSRVYQATLALENENGDGVVDEDVVDTPKRRRVNNLSSFPLDKTCLEVLSKGPNFALTQNISEHMMLEAEKAVERLAYAKRWKDTMARTHLVAAASTSSVDPAPRTGPETVATSAGAGSRGTSAATREHGPTTTAAETAAETGLAGIDTGGSTETGTTPTSVQRNSKTVGLSFKFADTDKRFPPPSTMDVEVKLKKLKEDVVKTYKSHKVQANNTSGKERRLIGDLRSNAELVIKQSDKGKGFVVLDKNTYIDKAQNILGDVSNYEKLDKNTVPKV